MIQSLKYMNNSKAPIRMYAHTYFSDIVAGLFMIILSLTGFLLICQNAHDPQKNVLLLFLIGFMVIGISGLWHAFRINISKASTGQYVYTRTRLVTNHVIYRLELKHSDIGYIHFAYSATRGGGLW